MAADLPPSDEVAEWVRLGREALRERRYAEAGGWFDRALAARPEDPQLAGLSVTAEFWRRLAREGDGFAPADPPAPPERPLGRRRRGAS